MTVIRNVDDDRAVTRAKVAAIAQIILSGAAFAVAIWTVSFLYLLYPIILWPALGVFLYKLSERKTGCHTVLNFVAQGIGMGLMVLFIGYEALYLVLIGNGNPVMSGVAVDAVTVANILSIVAICLFVSLFVIHIVAIYAYNKYSQVANRQTRISPAAWSIT